MLPALLVVLCVVFRVLPHPPNFAPAGAVAVFAGRTMKPQHALALVAVSMLASDFALARVHGYAALSWVTPFIYAGFFAQTLLGRALRARRGGAVGAALGGSMAFFVLSNTGVWLAGGLYPPTPAGLVACFVAAIPFFGATVVSDLVWTLALSGGYHHLAARLEARGAAAKWVPVSTRELAPA